MNKTLKMTRGALWGYLQSDFVNEKRVQLLDSHLPYKYLIVIIRVEIIRNKEKRLIHTASI